MKFFSQPKSKPKLRSIKFEITVIYTLILGLILTVFSGVFYVILSRTLYSELDTDLRAIAQETIFHINTYLEHKGAEENKENEAGQTLQFAVETTIASEGKPLQKWWSRGFERSWYKTLDKQDLSDHYIHFIAVDQKLSIRSKTLIPELAEEFQKDIELSEGLKEKLWNLDLPTRQIRVINFPFWQDGLLTHIIQVGVSKNSVIYLLENWMKVFFISIPALLLLTSLLGWWLTSSSLRPVHRIITLAQQMSYGDLNLRVEPKQHYKEMDRLIGAFNDMLSRLEKSFHYIEEFNIHVAHELKTPLTIIRGESELLTLSLESNENKKAMETIIEEVDKILRTIDDMLFLSKTNYQPDAFNFEAADLNQLLLEISECVHLLIVDKNIQFTFYPSEESVLIYADRLHLRRLFLNLIDNAIKFTPQGGKIVMSLHAKDNDVFVSVKDTGVGISNENIEKVFDQFFRGDSYEKGVGLGLSIARAIAKAHSGQIRIASVPSEGTEFIVRFPGVHSPNYSLA